MDRNSAIELGQGLLAQGTKDALGSFYDQIVADIPQGEGGGLTQADVDAAVAAQMQQDQEAANQAKADFDAQMASLQQELSDMTAKEGQDQGVISDLQSKIASLKDSADKLQDMANYLHSLFPVPAPQPEPEPQPEPQPEEQPEPTPAEEQGQGEIA